MIADWMARYAAEGLHVRFAAAPPEVAGSHPADPAPLDGDAGVRGPVGIPGPVGPKGYVGPTAGANAADWARGSDADGEQERPGKHVIKGRAIVYDQETAIGPPGEPFFYEVIAKGAATKSMAERECLARYNHEAMLARTSGGTMRLEDSDDALRYEIDLNMGTTTGRDCWARVRRGDLGGSSFAFSDVAVKRVKGHKDNLDLFVVEEIRLFEAGPVDTPAYAGTGKPSAEARSAEEVREHWRRVVTSRERLASGGVAMDDELRVMKTRMDLLNLRLRFAPEVR